MADGEILQLGKHALRWLDTSHVPHGWECGLMFETQTKTLLCGDLFAQGGAGNALQCLLGLSRGVSVKCNQAIHEAGYR